MKNYLITNSKDKDFLNDLFNDFFVPGFGDIKSHYMATDVKKGENGITLFIEMPGYNKEEINISYEKGYLTVSAERSVLQEEKEQFLRRERVNVLKRSYYVGEIDENTISAKYENGLLTVNLPKKQKCENVKRIVIE